MSQGFTIYPIAHIQTDFKEKFGIPRQSGRVETIGKIIFEPKYRSPEALRGIESFSHLWLIFDFSLAHREEFSPTVRPPRLGGNTRVGVFASRSPFRPNAMGLSSVKLLSLEHNEKDGDYLIVSGADLLDGTPIYDIKPYLPLSVNNHLYFRQSTQHSTLFFVKKERPYPLLLKDRVVYFIIWTE